MDLCFTDSGLLSYSPGVKPIQLNLEEIRACFGWNSHREYLYDAWQYWIREIMPVRDSLTLIVFGSFVTKKDEPQDIDCLVVVDDVDNPVVDRLQRLELWTMQNVEVGSPVDAQVGVSKRKVSRVQPLGGLVDAYFVLGGGIAQTMWMSNITTKNNGERCGFVVVQL